MMYARQFIQSERLIAIMITILILGMVVDALFLALANQVRRNRGLTGLAGAPS